MTRRLFVVKSIKAFFALLGAILTSTALLFYYPSRIRKKGVRFFPVTSEEKLPRRGIRMFVFPYEKNGRSLNTRAFIVSSGGRLFALSPVCSHLGCLVTWSRSEGRFLCPCHGGKYDMEGNVLEGPPPAPLARLPMKVEGNRVYIGLKV